VDRAKWQYFAEAKGDVKIPAGKRLWLQISSPSAWQDLSPLSFLRPDDLYQLSIDATSTMFTGRPKPDDRCMRHIAALTALKVLHLGFTDITGRGMKAIAGFESLERLTLPDRIDDADMARVATLKSLKGLYWGPEIRVTDAGLRHLTKLPLLEELAIGGIHISNDGLAHVAKLPRLRYLMLRGRHQRLTDAGLVHLQNAPSLKILHFGGLRTITDAGLEHLSRIPSLEIISFHWNENITNDGIAHLKKLPALRKLDIACSRVGDEGLAHLKEIKTLEYLELPPGVIYRRQGPIFTITDQGLAHLAQLENLKRLHVGCLGSGSAITNAGLRCLAKLTYLEELLVGGKDITDEGVREIAKLTNLTYLALFGCPKLGDNALSELAKIRGLRKLDLFSMNMTASALRQLNGLSGLTDLHVDQIEKGDAPLDISGLRSLEKLSISLKREAVFEDDDLVCLGKLKQLRWLQIYPCAFSDAGIAHLAGLTNMERLGISGPKMTDKGLSYLSNMKNLNHLTVTDGNLTDKSLRHLERLRALSHLTIRCKNDFSPAAVERLRRELPNLPMLNIEEGKKQ
jgi:Leucine-rich repeat (LRR) protein